MNPAQPFNHACALLAALLAGLVPAALLAGCGAAEAPSGEQRVVAGAPHVIGGGSAYAWVALASDDRPSSVGITLDEAALAALPTNRDTAIGLRLPPDAVPTGLDQVELNWISQPAGARHDVYAQPRIDVHFHLIPPAARESIRHADGNDALPALARIPSSYVPSAEFMPGVGVHWIDPTAPEFRGQPFTMALLVGFHGGRMVFLEQRVARGFLATRPDITHHVTPPRELPRAGYFPTRHRVRFDAAARAFTISLEGLVRAP